MNASHNNLPKTLIKNSTALSESNIENKYECNSVKTFNEKESSYYDVIKTYMDNLKSSNEKPLEYKLK